MKIKRITALLLVFAMLFSFCPNVFADSKEQYGTLSVKWFSAEKTESLTVMVKDNYVYADASVLAEKFGYDFSVSGDRAVIVNYSPLRTIVFNENSKDVIYINGNICSHDGTLFNYSIPCKAISNENGFWVPFVYVLRLLDSGYLPESSVISTPITTALSNSYTLSNKIQDYKFDIIRDLGDSNLRLRLCQEVTALNDIVHLDPSGVIPAITLGFLPSTYSIKYTEQLATLFCTQSQDEVRELADQISTAYDILSDSGELADIMKGLSNDSLDNLNDTMKKFQELMADKSTSSVEVNKMAKMLGKAIKNDSLINGTSTVVNELQSNFKSSDNISDYLSAFTLALNIYTYYQELQNQDKTALNALKGFSDYINKNNAEYVSWAGKENLNAYVYSSDFQAGIAVKSIFNALVNNMDSSVDLVTKGNIKQSLFGSSGSLILFAWDLASKYIPALKNSLDNADYSTLAIYSQAMQNETDRWYDDCLNNLYANPNDKAAWIEYAKSTYTFLKMSYISRENGICIANTYVEAREGKKDSKSKNEAALIKSYVSDLEKLNQNIIKQASFYYTLSEDFDNNDNTAYFGMIPPVEAEVKQNYSSYDSEIIKHVKNLSDEFSVYEPIELSKEEKQELAKLLDYVCDVEYDSNNPNDADKAVWLVIHPAQGMYGSTLFPESEQRVSYNYYYDDASPDPLNALVGTDGDYYYSKYDGESVDWILTNVLNSKPQHNQTTSTITEWRDDLDCRYTYYYYNGMYYATVEDAGWEGYGISYDKVLYNGKYYQIKFKCQYAPWLIADGVDANWPINTQYATLTKKNIYGKEYWSIVKTSKTPDIDFDVYYEDAEEPTWKQLYVNYIKKNEKKDHLETQYQLAYIDDNNVPELIIDNGSIAGGGEICLISNNKVNSLSTYTYGVSYLERKNLFCSSGGHMDVYYNKIYKINNGKFVKLYDGSYGAEYNANVQCDENGEPIYKYYWNDKEVSEAQYNKKLKAIFDKSKAINPYETAVGADVMISRIQNDFYEIYSAY